MFKSKDGTPIHVASTNSHVATVGGEWTEIPEQLHTMAMQLGCMCADSEMIELAEKHKATLNAIGGEKQAPPEKNSPEDKLRETLQLVVETDDKSLLTQAGIPNVEKVNKMLGFGFKREDVLRVWSEVQPKE
jgi:hypothetical protein